MGRNEQEGLFWGRAGWRWGGMLGKRVCMTGRKPHQLQRDGKYFSGRPLVWQSTNYKPGRCCSREGGMEPEIKLSAQQTASGDKEAASLGLWMWNCTCSGHRWALTWAPAEDGGSQRSVITLNGVFQFWCEKRPQTLSTETPTGAKNTQRDKRDQTAQPAHIAFSESIFKVTASRSDAAQAGTTKESMH